MALSGMSHTPERSLVPNVNSLQAGSLRLLSGRRLAPFPNGGGPLQGAPARVGEEILAKGTDIYRTSESLRHVYVLASKLAPGDSGGALVDTKGDVIGMAFAIDPGRSATAYALTDTELRGVLARAKRGPRTPVDTGRCLVP